jgi:sterol 3beta-glucosyltransferase
MFESRLDSISLAGVREKLKPIVFLTSGTRGDVQPAAFLARALQAKGRVVRVAAPPAFREIVESQSLPYVPLEGNPSDLLTGPGKQSALTFNDNPLRGLMSATGYLKEAQPVYARMIENGWRASQDASALVIGLPTIWGTSIAEKLGIPCIGAFLQPVTSTREFPSPLLPSTLKLGNAYNRLTYRLISGVVYWPWMRVINQWRNNLLGLNSLALSHNHFENMDSVIYGFSKRVVPRPKDWNKKNFITGYWLQPDVPYFSSPKLKTFFEAGNRPFYFGFGSPGMHEPKALIELLISAIKKAAIRTVISLPKDFEMDIQDENIFIQRESIPHSWLFPQMAGIVHHGGAGTTAEALRAGVPSFITPLAVDQFFWGERIFQLGMGPRAVPQRELTIEKLVNALNEMKDEKMKEKARGLAEELRTEDGTAKAVQAMEQILETGAG